MWPLLGLASLLFAATVGAEGGVRLLECTVVRVCDSAGNCGAASGRVSFRMQPTAIADDGSGDYMLSYRDIETEMRAESPAGPFYWAVGTERDTLIVSSETAFLWHRLTLDPVPDSTIRFLDCTFSQ